MPLQLVDPGVSFLTPLRDFMSGKLGGLAIDVFAKGEVIVLSGMRLRITCCEYQSVTPGPEVNHQRKGKEKASVCGHLRLSRKAFRGGTGLSSKKQSCPQAVEGETGEHNSYADNVNGRSQQ